MEYVLYTYGDADPQCRVYGPGTEQECEAAEAVVHNNPTLEVADTMVLPLEPFPTEELQPA